MWYNAAQSHKAAAGSVAYLVRAAASNRALCCLASTCDESGLIAVASARERRPTREISYATTGHASDELTARLGALDLGPCVFA